SKFDCDPCPLKAKCCPNMPWRKVPRDVHEAARDQARALMGTPEFEKSRDERKRVEMRFAHLKTHHRFERMRLRGLTAHATNSTWRPSRRTSKRSRTTLAARRQTSPPRARREGCLCLVVCAKAAPAAAANERGDKGWQKPSIGHHPSH